MYTVPIYLKGKGANSSAGFEGETCKQPCNLNKEHPGERRRLHREAATEKVEGGARCALSELGIVG